MTETIDRPHILTDNERYGSGFLDESAPGAWVVRSRGDSVLHAIFSNRTAAEEYIYDHLEEHDYTSGFYTLSVWAIHDTWRDDEED